MACKIVIPAGNDLLIEIISGVMQAQDIKVCESGLNCEVLIDNFDEFQQSVYQSLQLSSNDNYEKHQSYNVFQDSLKTLEVVSGLPC